MLKNQNELLEKLDSFLHKNDYKSAEEYLLSSLEGATVKTEILIRNELMGLYRKLGKEQQAIFNAEKAMEIIFENSLDTQVGSATTFLNAATVYKAFNNPEKSISLFKKARKIYEEKLPKNDVKLAGLYNNMGLTLVDLCCFDEAQSLYKEAIEILEKNNQKALDKAVTYLNMASAYEAKLGLLEGDEIITEHLNKAKEILENYPNRDGYYAFVCEKCATVFGYYGHFFYEKELKERAEKIYEGN